MASNVRATLALAVLLLPTVAAAGARGSELTWDQVASACGASASAPEGSAGARVRAACERVKGWPSAAQWAAQGALPTAADFHAVAEAPQATLRAEAGAWAPAEASALARPRGTLPTDPAAGAAEFLMNRAEEELRLWLVDRLFDTLCDRFALGSARKVVLLPETCRLEDQLHFAGIASSPTLLRAAIQKDLAGLPAMVLLGLVEDAAQGKVHVPMDRLLVAHQLTVAIEETLVLGDAREGFGQVARRVPAAYFESRWVPVAAALRELSGAFASLPSRADPRALPDATWGIALLRAAVNAADDAVALDANWPWQHGGDAAAVSKAIHGAFERARQVEDAVAAISAEVRKRDDKGAAAAAREAVAKAARGWGDLARRLVPEAAGVSDVERILSEARAALDALAARQHVQALAHVVRIAGLAGGDGPGREKALRAAALALEISDAKDASTVEAALNRYAAPTGSYVGKHRGSRIYLNVNGYFGAFAGRERSQQLEPTWSDATWAYTAAVWAPIGLEWGLSTQYGSVGLFGQVVDFGVIASFRMFAKEEEAVEAAPSIGFREVFSPGGYLVWGFRNAPISLAAGASLAPSLRKVGGTADEARDAWRYGVALAIDIPIFP